MVWERPDTAPYEEVISLQAVNQDRVSIGLQQDIQTWTSKQATTATQVFVPV